MKEEWTMLDTTHNFNKTNTGVPIKAWTKGVQLEDQPVVS